MLAASAAIDASSSPVDVRGFVHVPYSSTRSLNLANHGVAIAGSSAMESSAAVPSSPAPSSSSGGLSSW